MKNLPIHLFLPSTNIYQVLSLSLASLVAQRLKHLPAMRETRVQSLGWEDPLEKEMVTHSSILAWRILWMEEPGGLHLIQEITKSQIRLSNFTFTFFSLCHILY